MKGGVNGFLFYLNLFSHRVKPYLCRLIKEEMFRTHTCGELRLAEVNREVTLAGWVQTLRKFGSITFIDLRDRYGVTQLLLDENQTAALAENPLGPGICDPGYGYRFGTVE